MLKGVFKLMALQNTAVIITLTGHYGLNIFLIWLFAFKLDYKEIGLLYAKLGLEIYSLCTYVLVIHFQDWQKVIDETRERQKKDKDLIY